MFPLFPRHRIRVVGFLIPNRYIPLQLRLRLVMSAPVFGYIMDEVNLFFHAYDTGFAPEPKNFKRLSKGKIWQKRHMAMAQALTDIKVKSQVPAQYDEVYITDKFTMPFVSLPSFYRPGVITEERQRKLDKLKELLGISPTLAPSVFYSTSGSPPRNFKNCKNRERAAAILSRMLLRNYQWEEWIESKFLY